MKSSLTRHLNNHTNDIIAAHNLIIKKIKRYHLNNAFLLADIIIIIIFPIILMFQMRIVQVKSLHIIFIVFFTYETGFFAANQQHRARYFYLSRPVSF